MKQKTLDGLNKLIKDLEDHKSNKKSELENKIGIVRQWIREELEACNKAIIALKKTVSEINKL